MDKMPSIAFSNGASVDVRDLGKYEKQVLSSIANILPDHLKTVEIIRYILEHSIDRLDSISLNL